MADFVNEEIIRRYKEDGAVLLPQVLSKAWLDLIETGIKRNLNNPGPFSGNYFEGEPGAFYDDYCNYDNIQEYRLLLQCSPIADLMKKLLETDRLWLLYDQIFIKDGGGRRTPWHQDTSYLITEGSQIGSAWITLDAVAGEESLEFVPGSHRGPLFNGAVFETGGDDMTWYEDTTMPRLPDIEAERDKWNIVSWPVEPGDILILHPSLLHGGAAMHEGGRRRTLSLRMFGDDITYAPRPGESAPPFSGISEALKPGDPLRHPYFPQLRG